MVRNYEFTSTGTVGPAVSDEAGLGLHGLPLGKLVSILSGEPFEQTGGPQHRRRRRRRQCRDKKYTGFPRVLCIIRIMYCIMYNTRII